MAPKSDIFDLAIEARKALIHAEETGVGAPEIDREVLDSFTVGAGSADKGKMLSQFCSEIENCTLCRLHEGRHKFVFGVGNPDADVMFIGEGPGYWEDMKGKPFVGKAGKVLDELLESIGLKRGDIYITNVVKCRPPENRDPLPEEISACSQYLDRQILLIQPKVIVTLGRFALSYVFNKFGLKEEKISNVHGKVFVVNNIFGNLKIIPLYHPAVAVYNPNTKKILLKDFKKLVK